MTLKHFNGIDWINNGHGPKSRTFNIRDFENRYGINYVHEGAIDMSVDGSSRVRYEAPCAWFTFPGHFEYGRDDGGFWDNRYINFSGPRAAGYIQSGLIITDRQHPVFTVHEAERLRAAFDELRNYLNDYRMNYHRSVYMLEGLLLLLAEQRARNTMLPPKRTHAVLELCRGIHASCARDWDFEREAMKFGLSYTAFRRLFRSVTGYAPHQFLINARMEKASKLLKDERRSYEDVASAVGIADVYYFSRIFKRHYHLSPRAWREEMRGES
ncbi:MAG: helix-turn-helix transcriptional regulator [Spirochaetes bacterium]|nr:helix-turn-helix transcriptional regulator [Spirochaetota bacterium]